LFAGLSEPRFYFVHSYHLVCDDDATVAGWTTYGYRFASAVQQGSIFGTQFHPEKSHRYGMTLLRNFMSMSSDD
jgi:glutamine amidotransferase